MSMIDPGKRYMLMRLLGRRFALEVDGVAEISELLPEYPIPKAPPFLRGVVNIHGTVAAVLDLGIYLGIGPSEKGRTLLLLSSPGCSLAIVVEQVERMITADDIGAVRSCSDSLLPCELLLADGSAALIDLQALLASVEKRL